MCQIEINQNARLLAARYSTLFRHLISQRKLKYAL